jgi:hypothetical protein
MLKFTLATAAMLSTMSIALAHDAKGPHGGVVEHSGAYHVELVAKGKQVDVFVLDDALKPVDHTGQKGLAILVVGGKPARIPLEAAGKDRLTGSAPAVIKGAPKGAVQITLTSGSSVQVKF